MFDALERCGLRPKLLPELASVPDNLSGSLPVRFALLCWPLQETAIKVFCDRLKVPNEERELALLACRCKELLGPSTPAEFLNLFKRADAFRRAERFAMFLATARLAQPRFDSVKIEHAFKSAVAVDAGAIAGTAKSAAEIPALLDRAREQAIGKGKS